MSRILNYRSVWLFSMTAISLTFQFGDVHAQPTKIITSTAPQPTVVKPQGGIERLYDYSAALIVSASTYQGGGNGWASLPNTTAELDSVTDELVKQGFEVTRVYDPTAEQLQKEMSGFLGRYGDLKKARLLFFFSGHGHTQSDNQMSYIVPVDAKDPKSNYGGFISKAIPLEQFHTWVRQFSAAHFLAIFDTCFSGAIFTTKSSMDLPNITPDRWRYLKVNSDKAVRQFLSAGGANEKLPATSSFVPVLIEGLRGRASVPKDGYVTGKELGVFVEQTVSRIRNGAQNPVSGVSNDTKFIFGDIIFQYDKAALPLTAKHSVEPQIQPQQNKSEDAPNLGAKIQTKVPTQPELGDECEKFDCTKK